MISLVLLILYLFCRDMITEVVEDRTCHYNIKVTHEDKRIQCRALFPLLPLPPSSNSFFLSFYSSLLVTFQLYCFITNALCKDPLCHQCQMPSPWIEHQEELFPNTTVLRSALQIWDSAFPTNTHYCSSLSLIFYIQVVSVLACSSPLLAPKAKKVSSYTCTSCYLLAFCLNTVIRS